MNLKKELLYIANWKMQLPYTDSIGYAQNHRQEFIELASQHRIALCPSFTSLSSIAQLFTGSPVHMGAQDCSAYDVGSHTGQESAQSLAEIGCTFCIVGHSEQRAAHHETAETVARKMMQLFNYQIAPIVCVGEDEAAYKANNTIAMLQQQLAPVRTALEQQQAPRTLYLAYEPVWAIGTGVVPSSEYIADMLRWIKTYMGHTSMTIQILYGGSVNATTAPALKRIAEIDGFLIGSASLDFQKFKNIVL